MYAVGDVATVGVPKAGVFAEGAARVVAGVDHRATTGGEQPAGYDGRGSCYIEFGAGQVGRVDVDFLSGPKPTGTFQAPSTDLVAEKQDFGARRARAGSAADGARREGPRSVRPAARLNGRLGCSPAFDLAREALHSRAARRPGDDRVAASRRVDRPHSRGSSVRERRRA